MKGRRWKKYLYKNKYEGDCQLVSIVNAYYYLTGKTVKDEVYDELVEMCGCVAGACIEISKAIAYLDLQEVERYLYLVPYVPLEINVWHKFFGFHSVLAVGWSQRLDAYRILNFKHVTSSNGWIFREDLMHFTIQNPDKDTPRWMCRTIGLRK